MVNEDMVTVIAILKKVKSRVYVYPLTRRSMKAVDFDGVPQIVLKIVFLNVTMLYLAPKWILT